MALRAQKQCENIDPFGYDFHRIEVVTTTVLRCRKRDLQVSVFDRLLGINICKHSDDFISRDSLHILRRRVPH